MSKCDLCTSDCGARGLGPDVEDADLAQVPKGPQEFKYSSMFQKNNKEGENQSSTTDFWKVDDEGDTKKFVHVIEAAGRSILEVQPGALEKLAHICMVEIQHFFRHDHLNGWKTILDDPEATNNDKFVALQLLQNAVIASKKVLPACQDTGTAIVLGKRGELVWTSGRDEEELSKGIWESYVNHNLRYSQTAALDMFKEINTKCNLPAQLDLLATSGNQYEFLFIAKGGGSANKSFLYQQTKAVLNDKALRRFIEEKLRTLGTAACPPYHLALVIGGTSAELTMKTVKLASCRYYDDLPTSGDETGRAFRDLEWESIVMDIARNTGIGAQFGGKYFAHQARVIRLPRHGASCPIGLGVSCSADRQIKAKITDEGMFVEQLVKTPENYLPAELPDLGGSVVNIDLNRPMSELRKELSKYPVKTRLSLSGPIVVARDIAHAKLQERLETEGALPEYFRERMVYYAGPAKAPAGYVSGSFGPTTAGRMDSYVAPFMAVGGSFVTLAKGNRSAQVTEACKKYGGFYLGSIGGPAAILALNAIKKVEVLEYPELGMEAIWAIEVKDFPAFIVVDDKGNDFFQGVV